MAKVQDTCLIQMDGAGAEYMNMFDQMVPEMREYLRNSPWNLCPACVVMECGTGKDVAESIAAIQKMEARVAYLEERP